MFGLVALLLVVGAVVRYWYLVAAVVGMIVAAHCSRLTVEGHFARLDAERRRLAGLRDRADRQHNWVMHGDPRGTYGESVST